MEDGTISEKSNIQTQLRCLVIGNSFFKINDVWIDFKWQKKPIFMTFAVDDD